ncbi:MAG: HAD family hydrolase [Anaerolineae bacterium]
MLALSLSAMEMAPILAQFYDEEFPKLQPYTQPVAAVPPLLANATARGYGLVVATNPIFPLRAIQHRIAWAGAADVPWLYVTSYETMHFAKPHPEYHLEILERIGRTADRCLMIGDNMVNDIAPAKAVGMRTFWATENPRSSVGVAGEGRTGRVADHTGTLDDLRHLIQDAEGMSLVINDSRAFLVHHLHRAEIRRDPSQATHSAASPPGGRNTR